MDLDRARLLLARERERIEERLEALPTAELTLDEEEQGWVARDRRPHGERDG